MKVRYTVGVASGGRGLLMWCPGCEDLHRVTFGSAGSWSFDGNEESPTVDPSIKVTGVQWPEESEFYKPRHAGVAAGDPTVCHSYLHAGVWEFLADCTHSLAGQHVPMVDLPGWLSSD